MDAGHRPHAGIATQAVVEKRLKEIEGKTRHDLGREALVDRIWQWKDQYEARILGQLKRMVPVATGAARDSRWTRLALEPCAPRFTTCSLRNSSIAVNAPGQLGYLLQTAVSDDEVFHEVVKGHFYYMRYPIVDAPADGPQFVSIATTRPETMLGDTAVAVHPDPAAAIDAAEAALQTRIAEAAAKDKPALERQLEELQERKTTVLPELIKLRDLALAGAKVRVPLINREVPLVADTWAKPEMVLAA